MMKILVVCFLAISVFVIVNGQEIDHKYDNFDVDEVLNNQRILKNYIKCMLDKGPCTPEGKDFRRYLPDALQTACEKCNPGQRQRMRKVTVFIRDKRPQDWAELLAKFDPEGKYKAKFDEFAMGTD